MLHSSCEAQIILIKNNTVNKQNTLTQQTPRER